VADRLAQTVVAMVLEPLLAPYVHPASYGDRPGTSAHQALGMARQRCWRCDWVLDLDLKGFCDHLAHTLLLRALWKPTACPWVLLYVARGFQAPVPDQEGPLLQRGQGVPQGGGISPVRAHLFVHEAFDAGMQRAYPAIPFERYADASLVHGPREGQAHELKARLAQRLAPGSWERHPTKPQIVYGQEADRQGTSAQERFDFLGDTLRPRRSRNRWGTSLLNCTPAVSARATQALRQTMRSWRLHLRSDTTLDDLAHMFNPLLRGGVNDYGQSDKSAF